MHSDLPLYHSNVVRTLFLDFEESDGEKQLEDFHNTDVEVPARMTLDGKEYQGVGIHFRGASSYFMNGPGSKRYLTHVKQIASQSLDWSQLGTAAERYHSLIAPQVSSDTRKLASTKQFESSLVGPSGSGAEPGRGAPMAVKAFFDQRRAYLLSLPELQALP